MALEEIDLTGKERKNDSTDARPIDAADNVVIIIIIIIVNITWWS